MPAVDDQAVCLRHWEWSETSQTVLLFCREHGLVRALAKGSRRPKSPYSGGLEVLTVGSLEVILKPDGALALLTSWELREPMLHLRTSLIAWEHALIAGEVTARMLSEHDPHPGVFDALTRLLDALRDVETVSYETLCFLWTTLRDCGYEIALSRDVRTGEPLSDAESFGFAPASGGVTTDPGPSSREIFDQRNPVWRVRGETVVLLRSLRHPRMHTALGPISLDSNETHTGPATPAVRRALRLLLSYVQYLIGSELVSARQIM